MRASFGAFASDLPQRVHVDFDARLRTATVALPQYGHRTIDIMARKLCEVVRTPHPWQLPNMG